MPPQDVGAGAAAAGDPPALQLTRVEGCPTCGAPGSRPWLSAHDLLHGIPGTFDYRRCRRCRTVFQAPQVADESLAECYPDEYFTHEAPADGGLPDGTPGWRAALRAHVLGSLSD